MPAPPLSVFAEPFAPSAARAVASADTIRRFARDQLASCGGLATTMDAFVDVVLGGALDARRGNTLVWRRSGGCCSAPTSPEPAG